MSIATFTVLSVTLFASSGVLQLNSFVYNTTASLVKVVVLNVTYFQSYMIVARFTVLSITPFVSLLELCVIQV